MEILLYGTDSSTLKSKMKTLQTSKHSLGSGWEFEEKSKTRYTGKFSNMQGGMLPPPSVLCLGTVPLGFWQQPEQSNPSDPEA